MADSALDDSISDFLKQYSEAFEAIDGNRIAALLRCCPTPSARCAAHTARQKANVRSHAD
jgi:hypothetical protein